MKKIALALLVTSVGLMAAVNGKSCAACHGADWSKPAMGVSKVVSEMTHADIEATLLGYKNTPGFGHSNMKGAMAGQVKRYSDEELKAFSQTIGK